jgi:hypothetical protein
VAAPVLVCPACLFVLCMERALDLAIILTQFLVFLSIFFFFRCFLGLALYFRIFEVGLLGHCLVPNSFGVLAGDHDSASNLAVVSVMCGISAYPTMLVGQTF